jgi:hypothetical protein
VVAAKVRPAGRAQAEIAGAALGADAGGYRAEFLDLVRKMEAVSRPDRR